MEVEGIVFVAFLGSANMAQSLIGAVFFSSHDVSGLFNIPPEVPPEKYGFSKNDKDHSDIRCGLPPHFIS